MVELEEYLVSIDKDHLNRLSDDYRQKMLEYDLRDVAENNGKCYLAVINDTVVGMIMGILRNYSDMDHLDYLCPKTGIITELIVKTEFRYHSIGQTLMRAIESYFLEIGCEYVLVDVFAYNTSAQRFYEKEGYHARMILSSNVLLREVLV
ncbi:MAG: GNAT family N-acetyltransferase [Clostridia bacterium]|nr:GNAT family N-acetyltransferase [Clostridia bacterium]